MFSDKLVYLQNKLASAFKLAVTHDEYTKPLRPRPQGSGKEFILEVFHGHPIYKHIYLFPSQ